MFTELARLIDLYPDLWRNALQFRSGSQALQFRSDSQALQFRSDCNALQSDRNCNGVSDLSRTAIVSTPVNRKK
jgi:hypothetical protein